MVVKFIQNSYITYSHLNNNIKNHVFYIQTHTRQKKNPKKKTEFY